MTEVGFSINLRTGKLTNDVHSGMCGFISWRRLFEEALRSSGELHPHEKAIAVEANERGLTFVIGENEE
jgi:hypothetical protein